jgi:uncharacterized protein YlxW (UPF0749 family)
MILPPNFMSLGIEVFLAVLLMIAIAYCARLDGKLKALRTGNNRMLEAAKELQSSVLHAENAVTALRRSADAAGRELQHKIDEARAMAQTPIIREVMIDDRRDSHAGDSQSREAHSRELAPRGNIDFSLRRRSVL